MSKRGLRAAVVVPVALAIAQQTGSAQATYFAAFGSIAFLVMMGFSGPWRLVARDVALTGLLAAVLVALGTLCSRPAALAVVMMGVVGFVILFGSAVSPSAVRVTTGLLLMFVLPVSLPGSAGEIGPRLAGLGIALAFAGPALVVVFPCHIGSPLRHKLASALSALSDVARLGPGDPTFHDRIDVAETRIADVLDHYEHTANLPIGLGHREQSLGRLVGLVSATGRRLCEDRSALERNAKVGPPEHQLRRLAARAFAACADLLRRSGNNERLTAADGQPLAELPALVKEDQDESLRAMLQWLAAPDAETAGRSAEPPPGQAAEYLEAIDVGLRRRVLGQLTGSIVDGTLVAVDLKAPPGQTGPPGLLARTVRWFRAAAAELESFARLDGVWFRNSLRAAVALALAVLVITQVHVQHGFWVILGTLSVLRSNAAGTRTSAVNAVAGTAVGVLIGSLLLLALQHNRVALWVVLPLAVFLAGVASAAISFLAGQAAFSLAVLVLFQILAPGQTVGLIRVGDVAIGCGVALGMSILFWPRGATGAFGRSLGRAMARTAEETLAAVHRFLAPVDHPEETDAAASASASAFRRLDDAYRQYLLERGDKPVPVGEVTGLFTEAMLARFDADVLAGFPRLTAPSPLHLETVEACGAAILHECATLPPAFELVGAQIRRKPSADVPPPPPPRDLRPLLLAAITETTESGDRNRIRTAMRLTLVADDLDRQWSIEDRMVHVATNLRAGRT